jgi:hypothetical protein
MLASPIAAPTALSNFASAAARSSASLSTSGSLLTPAGADVADSAIGCADADTFSSPPPLPEPSAVAPA